MDGITTMFESQVSPEIFTSIFAGGFVVSIMGYLAFTLRAAPTHIWRFLKNQFSVMIVITSDQPAFYALDLWLSRHPSSKKARRLMAVSQHHDGEDTHSATLGLGYHLIRHGGRHWWISRQREGGASANGGRPITTLEITTLGRSPAPVLNLLDEVNEGDDASQTVGVMYWANGYYRRLPRKRIRELDSVILRPGLAAELVDDLRRFLADEDWYSERGIPWRRGILLEGPPGTGKSSLIFAIAGALRKPIYIITPSMVQSDQDLQEAMLMARGGIVVIEDIDAAFEAKARKKEGQTSGPEREGVTLSGLLNAICGIAAGEGRILFLTSNHPDKLDNALLRPGRIDRREHLDLADEEIADAMYDRFFPSGNGKIFWLENIKKELPMSPAAIQERLIRIAREEAA